MSKISRLLSVLLIVILMTGMSACKSNETVEDTGDGGATETTDTSQEKTQSETGTTSEPDDLSGVVYGGDLVSYYSEFYSEFDPSVYSNRQYVSFYTDMLWNIDWDTDRSVFNFDGSYIDSNYISGQIAESWEIADDYTSMTVTLRDDVYFQDKSAVGIDSQYDIYGGRQLVASDIKWTYDRLLGLDGATQVVMDMTTWPTVLAMLDSVEVVDDATVKFYFNTDNELSVGQFMCAFVNIGGPEWDALAEDQKTDWHYAAGTGPFILTDYVADNSLTFVANPSYWDTDSEGNKLPYLDSVKLLAITDEATRLSSFLAGDLDIIATNGGLSEDSASVIRSSMTADEFTEYKSYSAPLGIGLKIGSNPVEALTDIKVREAMQYAMDLESFSIYSGYNYADGVDIMGLWLDSTAYADIDSWPEGLKESYTTYDPDKARELLAEAGYADGFSFDVTIFSMLDENLFQMAAEYLAEVGIEMNLIVGNAPPDMTAVGNDGANPGCIFNTYGYQTVNMANSGIRSDGSNTYIHHSDSHIDELLDSILGAKTLEEQITYARELDPYVMNQHYTLLITGSQITSLWHSGRVHGLNGESLNSNYYYGFMYARTWLVEE